MIMMALQTCIKCHLHLPRQEKNKPSTDWNGFVNALKAIKFDKVLSFETAPVLDSFPVEMREDTLAFIAKIGRYFAEKIEDK